MLHYELSFSAALGMVSINERFCFCEMPMSVCVCVFCPFPSTFYLLTCRRSLYTLLNFFIEV